MSAHRHAVKPSAALLAAATLATACTSGAVINNDDPRPPVTMPTTTQVPHFGTANLVDASAYLVKTEDRTGYFFSSPSGRWHCAILPHEQAGCQLAGAPASGIGIATAPTSVPDGAGGTATPNAIAVDHEHDAAFLVLQTPTFSVDTPEILPFGKVLAVAGFRCNIQPETGVSCVRELTGKGFTFSGDNVNMQYTDAP